MKTLDRQSEIFGVKGPRIDGPLKVTGQALYTSDHLPDAVAYAVPLGATIGLGQIKKLKADNARKVPGVLTIFSHGNLPGMYRHGPDLKMVAHTDEQRPPFEDEIIRYYGQYVALVVAETLEIAQAAARLIEVEYEVKKSNLVNKLELEALGKTESERGHADKVIAPHNVDHTYTTPVEVHNPIEMHATVAAWDSSGKLNLFETTQAVMNHRAVIAGQLGVPETDVRVVSRFLGSGFGGKLWPWTHSVLAAAAARALGRPIKLVLSRAEMFTNVGHRPRTQQRVRLGADAEGHLVLLQHDYVSQASQLDDYKENCGEATPYLYACKNLKVTSGIARRDIAPATSMRGPGAVPGLFALESAMDELAILLNLDPLELRRRNEPETDESTGQKFSSRHLLECLELGARQFGWQKRQSAVGSMTDGNEILGWGLSACSWGAKRLACRAVVEFRRDGCVRVSAATQDIGTGTYTVLQRIVSEELGLPPEAVVVTLGDSLLTPGPISGGSMATASVIPAVINACAAARGNLLKVASDSPGSPFKGLKPEQITLSRGELSATNKQIKFGEMLTRANVSVAGGSGESEAMTGGPKAPFSLHSYGAHFVEVGWQPKVARLRVRRVITVIDGGHIVNPITAKNQVEGAIVMGLGMGLFEEAIYDARNGQPVNANLADYILATHADCPDLEVTFLDHPDRALNSYGARGIGEIGLAGVAPALANAVYHASGVRVRELPIMLEKLI